VNQKQKIALAIGTLVFLVVTWTWDGPYYKRFELGARLFSIAVATTAAWFVLRDNAKTP
jgi:MFS superfamily sulfate permease-like transporter